MEIRSIQAEYPVNRKASIDEIAFISKGKNTIPGSGEEGFDYNKVLMDLDDVKSFLYLIMGNGVHQLKQDEKVGSNINKLA